MLKVKMKDSVEYNSVVFLSGDYCDVLRRMMYLEDYYSSLGFYVFTTVNLGNNVLCDWGIDILFRGVMNGGIYLFKDKDKYDAFKLSKLDILNNKN